MDTRGSYVHELMVKFLRGIPLEKYFIFTIYQNYTALLWLGQEQQAYLFQQNYAKEIVSASIMDDRYVLNII